MSDHQTDDVDAPVTISPDRHDRPILLVGCTGMVGRPIAEAILALDGRLRATIRPGGYTGDKVDLVNSLRDKGMETFEADLSKPESLDAALDGVDTVVSVLQGLGGVMIDAQTRLLGAAQKNGVRRFIPSDYAADLYHVPCGANRNYDLRRVFAALLDDSGIAATSVLNGCFAEMLVMHYPLLDAQSNAFHVWGDGKQGLDFTSIADTAKFTAEVALRRDTPRKVCVAGDTVNSFELADRLGQWLGQSLEIRQRGSIDDLVSLIAELKKEPMGDQEYPPWQGLQYTPNMVSGLAKLRRIDNSMFPTIEPENLSQFLAKQPRPDG